MATEADLLQAVKDLLHTNGQLKKLQAEVRAKITDALREQQTHESREPTVPPAAPVEVALINELIREYLEWNGYLYTASVLGSEAGLGERKSRVDICVEVGVKDDERSSKLPLLTNIVTAYTERIRKKINKAHK